MLSSDRVKQQQEIKNMVRECYPFSAQHPITEDLEVAEQLQILFELGDIVTISKDGFSARSSNLSRTRPIAIHRQQLWFHTVLFLEEFVVDIWHEDVVIRKEEYLQKLELENGNGKIKLWSEDLGKELEWES